MKDFEISNLKFENYAVSNSYYRKCSKGGGVLILSKLGIKYKNICLTSISDLCNDRDFECCVTEFRCNHLNFVLAVIYRSPDYTTLNIFFQKLDALLDILVGRFVNVVVCGDLNINVLKNSPATDSLNSILTAHAVRYVVDFPTRVTKSSSSAIDNFITNLGTNKCRAFGVITALSDHDGQVFEILTQSYLTKKCNSKAYRRVFSASNIKLFNDALLKETWADVYLASVERKYDVFLSIFLHYFNLYFPKKYVAQRIKKKSTWITKEILLLK